MPNCRYFRYQNSIFTTTLPKNNCILKRKINSNKNSSIM
ncbi:MAG: hypothetical protein DKM24_07505 [Candidatus Melainabacteria bacterium]|nr:MAG: hypothetical protein DKM24_07505 [Candidatus Melainabacteria bacterium]